MAKLNRKKIAVRKNKKRMENKKVKKPMKKVVKLNMKKEKETVAQFKKFINKTPYKKLLEYVDLLQQRWQSNSKYEDFDSYVAIVKKNVPEPMKFVAMYADFTVVLKWKKREVVLINVTPRSVNSQLLSNKEIMSLTKKRK